MPRQTLALVVYCTRGLCPFHTLDQLMTAAVPSTGHTGPLSIKAHTAGLRCWHIDAMGSRWSTNTRPLRGSGGWQPGNTAPQRQPCPDKLARCECRHTPQPLYIHRSFQSPMTARRSSHRCGCAACWHPCSGTSHPPTAGVHSVCPVCGLVAAGVGPVHVVPALEGCALNVQRLDQEAVLWQQGSQAGRQARKARKEAGTTSSPRCKSSMVQPAVRD